MCEGGREGCSGAGESVRVREREGYPLHCCVTGNLIEREREGGRKAAGEGRGEREREEGATQCKSTERKPLLLELQRTGTSCGHCMTLTAECEAAGGSSERLHIVHTVEKGDQGHAECAV